MNRERSGVSVIITSLLMSGLFLTGVHYQAKKSAQADARLRVILPFNTAAYVHVLENNVEIPTVAASSIQAPEPMPTFTLKPVAPAPEESQDITSFATISPADAARMLKPLALTHSVEEIAKSLKDVSPSQALAIVDEIVKDADVELGRNDILELVFALLSQHKTDQVHIDALLGYLLDHKLLDTGESVLFVAADHYPDVIMTIVQWSNRYMKQLQDHANVAHGAFAAMQEAAFQDAVSKNDSKKLDILIGQGIIPTDEMAQRLLARVVQENKEVGFITALAKFLKNIDMDMKDGRTLLMLASEHGNAKQVEEIIFQKADVNKMLDPKVGTAIQLAIVKEMEEQESLDKQRFTQVINALRSNGAKESVEEVSAPAESAEQPAVIKPTEEQSAVVKKASSLF